MYSSYRTKFAINNVFYRHYNYYNKYIAGERILK